jgi:dolichyl-phosphate-mannose-protein mannosyltransferase
MRISAETLHFTSPKTMDILFAIFVTAYTIYLYSHVLMATVPPSDGADYLLNAQGWLYDSPIYSTVRPPLISWIIAGIWILTGENWIFAEYVLPVFVVGAGIVLYLLLREKKGGLFAFGVSALTMLNPQVFFWSTHIHTEALSLFFLVLSLYCLKSQKESHWLLAGIFMGLTFASRYPIFLQAITIFIVEAITRKNPKLAIRTIVTLIPVIAIVITIVVSKTGTFVGANDYETQFTLLLSNFYLVNAVNNWGYVFLLLPIAFLFKRTYTDQYNYSFIAWFVVSIIFWSANSNPILHESRYIVQFTPAVYYLVILAIENIANLKMKDNNLLIYKFRKGNSNI